MSITSTTDRRVSTQSSMSLPSELAMRESASDDPEHVEPSAATFLRGNADDDGGAQLGIPVTPYSVSQPQLTSGAEVRLGAIARWADPRDICTGTALARLLRVPTPARAVWAHLHGVARQVRSWSLGSSCEAAMPLGR